MVGQEVSKKSKHNVTCESNLHPREAQSLGTTGNDEIIWQLEQGKPGCFNGSAESHTHTHTRTHVTGNEQGTQEIQGKNKKGHESRPSRDTMSFNSF